MALGDRQGLWFAINGFLFLIIKKKEVSTKEKRFLQWVTQPQQHLHFSRWMVKKKYPSHLLLYHFQFPVVLISACAALSNLIWAIAHLLLFRSWGFFLHEWSLLIVHLITDRKPHATAVRRASSSCCHYLWWLPSGSSMNPDITSLYRYRLREVKKMVTNVTTFLL